MSRDIVPINERDLFWKDPFFSTTWDEFDKMRQDMMAKSKDFWGRVNKDMANFDDAVKKSHAEMDLSMAPFRPQLPAWAIPETVKEVWKPMMTKTNDEVIKVTNDDSKFEVTLDVSEYKPEELKVTTVNNTLAIEGKHESSRSDEKNTPASTASGSSTVMRQFSRKWTLPSDANPNEVVSNLSSDGILMITAPRKGAITTQVPVQKAIN